MRVTIRHKHIVVTSALEEYVKQKLILPAERFAARFGKTLPILDIEVARATAHHHKGRVYHAAASLTIGKTLLRAESEGEDIHAACDALNEELTREIKRFTSKARAKMLRGSRAAKRELRYHPAARPSRGQRVRNEGE